MAIITFPASVRALGPASCWRLPNWELSGKDQKHGYGGFAYPPVWSTLYEARRQSSLETWSFNAIFFFFLLLILGLEEAEKWEIHEIYIFLETIYPRQA